MVICTVATLLLKHQLEIGLCLLLYPERKPIEINQRIEFESIKQQFENLFRDDDRRPTLTKKPPKSDDVRPSIAEQINFGGDYKDKEELNQPKKKENPVKGAGGVRQAYTGDTEPMNVRYYDKGFFERLKENLGFNEGGHLIGGEDQFNQGPFTKLALALALLKCVST